MPRIRRGIRCNSESEAVFVSFVIVQLFILIFALLRIWRRDSRHFGIRYASAHLRDIFAARFSRTLTLDRIVPNVTTRSRHSHACNFYSLRIERTVKRRENRSQSA